MDFKPNIRRKNNAAATSRWTKAKAAILRAGRSIKNKSYKYRYHIAYGLILLVIAMAGIHAQSKIKSLSKNLKVSESVITKLLGEKGIAADKKDLNIALGRALSHKEITTKLEEYARNPVKGLTIASMAKDICAWGPEVCAKGIRPRIHMPQINLADPGIAHWLKGQGNMSFDLKKHIAVDPKKLIPLQTELNAAKVIGIASAILQGKLDPESIPLVVGEIGNELYVVNGHHRWKAAEIAGKAARAVKIKAFNGVNTSRLLNAITLAPRGVTFAK